MVYLVQEASSGHADCDHGTENREDQQMDFGELLEGLNSCEQLNVGMR